MIFLLLSVMAFGQETGGQKFALIFAIGDYPAATGWPQISSLRDVGYLHKTLVAQGFPDDHIAVVANDQATMEGIRKAFSTLTEKVHPGDIVLVHFSSHGEQVEADHDNHIDGLDECIVTFNAKSPLRSTDYQKDQADYLRGHLLGDYLHSLREKLGKNGDLLVTMDDCHSGNGTRGLARVRGGAPPLVSVTFDPTKHQHSDSSMLSRDAALDTRDTAALAPYVVFAAARPEELDNETQDEETGVEMGSLTYAICKAFTGLSAATGYPSYRQLFARIQSIMNIKVPDQHPMMEGDGADRLLFGGKFVHQQPYIELASIDKANRQIVLNSGKLAGLDEGALIALCPAGTRDTVGVKPLVKGRIVSASNISSTAQLDGDIPIDQPVDGWAFVTARIYAVPQITVQIKTGHNSYTPAEAATIAHSLQDVEGVKIATANPTLILTKGQIKDTLKVAGNGYVFAKVQSPLNDAWNLKQKLQDYAQYVFIQSLSCDLPDVQVELKLYLRNPNGTPDTAATAARMHGGRFEAHNGDKVTLRIRNNGTKLVYVNVLDLQPDGGINSILPNMTSENVKISADQLALPPGQEYPLPAKNWIDIGPPYGTEDFKLFASPVKIDLEHLANTRGGVDANHPPTAMERLLRMSYNSTRGGTDNGASQPDAATLDYLFLIKPKP